KGPTTLTVKPYDIDPARFLEDHLAQASPDLLRQMLTTFINALMSADADAVCGAGYGKVSEERTNRRNGYRPRRFDTRAGSLQIDIPKLREGSYFPDWLLERRRRAERALTSVVATCYLERSLHSADGHPGPNVGDHGAVEVAGVGDGERTR